MINTLDGKKVKRGEICFVVGVTVGGVYTPCRCKAYSKNPSYSIPDESRVYSTRDACQKICDQKNKQLELSNKFLNRNNMKQDTAEFDALFNKVITQIRFHTISGKEQLETAKDIVNICKNHFDNSQVIGTKNLTEADLISFGSYLLSKERRQLYKDHKTNEPLKDRLPVVSHADLCNWKEQPHSSPVQVDGWISCEDRLPEGRNRFGDSIDCLIYDKELSATATAYYNHKELCWKILHFSTHSNAIHVTHWQPLPPNPAG